MGSFHRCKFSELSIVVMLEEYASIYFQEFNFQYMGLPVYSE